MKINFNLEQYSKTVATYSNTDRNQIFINNIRYDNRITNYEIKNDTIIISFEDKTKALITYAKEFEICILNRIKDESIRECEKIIIINIIILDILNQKIILLFPMSINIYNIIRNSLNIQELFY